MVDFWRTKNSLSKLRWDGIRLVSAVWSDIAHLPKDIKTDIVNRVRHRVQSTRHYQGLKNTAVKLKIVEAHSDDHVGDRRLANTSIATPRSKPIIFASYCAGKDLQGNLKFCGGTKELNLLVKLARLKGYEAYMVTYDGSYEPWLLDHQPHISLSEFQQIIRTKTADVRCVTSWATATAFIQASPNLYFWDMELAATEHEHFSVLARLYRHKIRSTASISRTIQAWHMAHFQRHCVLLPNFLDESSWSPQPERRQAFKVGYMNEGKHTESYIELIRNTAFQSGLDLEFTLISGVESEVLNAMRSCDVYLAMNIGKDPLWGEGCPRTLLESLSTGCVVIAFDVIGNRETLQHNYNSMLVPRYRPDLMAAALVEVCRQPEERERLRQNALSLIDSCHRLEARWRSVQEFLSL
jgi:glycosyltransferase involved in cell wall biosynthesis